MKYKNFKTEKLFKDIPSIEKSSLLQKSDFTQIIHMQLKPGDKIDMHKTPMEVSFYLSHGQLDMKIGDETEKIEAGTLVESPKNIPHGFINNYNSDVNILVIKHLLTK